MRSCTAAETEIIIWGFRYGPPPSQLATSAQRKCWGFFCARARAPFFVGSVYARRIIAGRCQCFPAQEKPIHHFPVAQ